MRGRPELNFIMQVHGPCQDICRDLLAMANSNGEDDHRAPVS